METDAYYTDNKEHGSMIPEHTIPPDLKQFSQWVLWQYKDRGPDRKPDKQPINPRNLHNAGVQWPNTWTNFPYAYERYRQTYSRGIKGIGFVLAGDPFVAIDMDNCVGEGEITPVAQEITAALNSYTELSPSGQGLRILVACPGFAVNRRTPDLEIYAQSRYVTITGRHLEGTPKNITLVDREQLTAILPAPQPPQAGESVHTQHTKHYQTSNGQLWERIFAFDRYGEAHKSRFYGDIALDRNDHSFTVIRLLNCLARWTRCDPVRMREMILMSPLRNDKWFEGRGSEDWLDHQIADAVAFTSGRKGRL